MSNQSAVPARQPQMSAWIGLFSIVAVAIGVRILGLSGRWLWLDELLSVNFAAHGFGSALVSVLRFDVHPPLYYLQLSIWALAGQSDSWLMMNSIAWSTAAVALLAYAAGRRYGLRIGLTAGLLLAVAPAALAYCDQVRMYSFLIFLCIWVWFAQEQWFLKSGKGLAALPLVASQLCVLYSHSAGPVMISGIVLFGGAQILSQDRRLLWKWLAAEFVVAALGLPAVVIGLKRGVTHPLNPGIADIAGTWNFLATGADTLNALGLTIGIGFLVLLVWLVIRRRDFDWLPIFGPLVVAALISHLFRPIWLDRIFVGIIPFLCLTMARGMLDARARRFEIIAVGIMAAIWLASGVKQQISREKGDGYKLAAVYLHETAKPGDVVLVDGDYNYWCFMWYYDGPRWGQPRHAFILNNDWAGMMQRLPHGFVNFLDLNETDEQKQIDGVTLKMWNRSDPIPESAGDVMLVRVHSSQPAIIGDRYLEGTVSRQQVVIERWQRAPTGEQIIPGH